MSLGPRDQKPRWGIPVNPWTGMEISEQQSLMLDRLREACHAVGDVLHEIEGTDKETYGYSTRRMQIAATHLEELHLMAMREVLDK